MKALVLCGGSGTRLRPLSHTMPKQLIPVAGRPVLVHVLENLRELGIEEIGVIVGDWREAIEAVLGDGSAFGARVTYIPQEAPLGLAHCVLIAREFLGEDDFVLYLGDTVLTEGVAGVAREFAAAPTAARIVVQKVADPRAFGVVETDLDGRVTRLVEKPRHPATDLAAVGVYFFTPAIHEAVAAVPPSARGEREITDAVQWLVDAGHEVRASVHSGFWRDTGRVGDLLDCNRELLNGLRRRLAGRADDASEIIGEVVIEEGAVVERSRVTGPVVIGAGAVVRDSHIGPHTAIGAGCVVEAAGIADAILLPGTGIRHVGGVHGSVLARESAAGPAVPRLRLAAGRPEWVGAAA
ncbi:glucose-1-phosphate thymidylyltransferase [Streptomyces ferrugineus]|uniref:Glucose-1-phosphate thymidylyltransferase n=1 Tax=Streptomyces ferrugineus TaxID=1413221 RepID=A0A7M2SHB6_9ACTN|nr:glucose-1-phosphate thymidylyltransferase [Streptomyces ferrugineus]QOV35720.1 glucose-1-phosphate thymidylyltransferase [Streptomyces ferrugineus]